MALSDRGLAVVLPQVQGEDFSQGINNFFATKRQQKALELQQYKLMREQEDKNAEFLADQIKQNRVLTGTPYDEVINGKLNDIYRGYAEILAKNPGMSKSDILMGLTRDLGDVSLWRQRAVEIKGVVEAQAEAFGANKNKIKGLLYNKIFRTPDGKFKRGSDLSPDMVEEEFDNLTYEHPEFVYNSTEGLEKYVKGFETETMDVQRKTVNSRRGYTSEKVAVKLPKGLYQIAEGGINQDGIVDTDKIQYIPKTREEILSDDRLKSGKLLAYNELIARGEVPTKEKIIEILPEVVNKFIQQRAPLSVTKKEEVKYNPVSNITINNSTPVQSKPDVFNAIANDEDWIKGQVPVTNIGGKSYYNVSAALPEPAKSNIPNKVGDVVKYKSILVDTNTKDIQATDQTGGVTVLQYGTPEWGAFSKSMQGQAPFEKLASQYSPNSKKPAKYKQSPIGVKRKPQPSIFDPFKF